MKLKNLGKTGLIVGGAYATYKAFDFVFDLGKAWMLGNVYAMSDIACDIDEIKELYKKGENELSSKSKRRKMRRINKLAEGCYDFMSNSMDK